MIRSIGALASLLPFLATPLLAQTQAELVARRDAKLADDWLKLAPWTTDYDAALAQARDTKKPIFAYFSRSYAP